MAYQPNIPTGIVPLLTDYLNLQGNFQELDTVFGVDHTLFSNGTPIKGYHKTVHMIPETVFTTTDGYGQLYCVTANDGKATSEELFWRVWNGSSNIAIQLTRNFLPVSSANGYSFIAGGMIVQWGQFSLGTSTSGAVVYPTPFTASPYVPGIIGTTSSDPAQVAGVNLGTVTTNGFTAFRTGTANITYYYIAIGT